MRGNSNLEIGYLIDPLGWPKLGFPLARVTGQEWLGNSVADLAGRGARGLAVRGGDRRMLHVALVFAAGLVTGGRFTNLLPGRRPLLLPLASKLRHGRCDLFYHFSPNESAQRHMRHGDYIISLTLL